MRSQYKLLFLLLFSFLLFKPLALITDQESLFFQKKYSEENMKIMRVRATAYSSEEGQTDETPFIMANGNHVYDGVVAANFLPFGTRVRFPELYGSREFVVEDRMNKRFQDRVDIWMSTRKKAKNFGIKNITIEIL